MPGLIPIVKKASEFYTTKHEGYLTLTSKKEKFDDLLKNPQALTGAALERKIAFDILNQLDTDPTIKGSDKAIPHIKYLYDLLAQAALATFENVKELNEKEKALIEKYPLNKALKPSLDFAVLANFKKAFPNYDDQEVLNEINQHLASVSEHLNQQRIRTIQQSNRRILEDTQQQLIDSQNKERQEYLKLQSERFKHHQLKASKTNLLNDFVKLRDDNYANRKIISDLELLNQQLIDEKDFRTELQEAVIERAHNRMNQLESTVNISYDTIEHLEQKLQRAKNANHSIENELTSTLEKDRQLEKQLFNKKHEVMKLQECRTILQNKLKEMKKLRIENFDLHAKVNGLNYKVAQTNKLEAKIAELEGLENSHPTTVVSLERALSSANGTIADLKESNKQLRNEAAKRSAFKNVVTMYREVANSAVVNQSNNNSKSSKQFRRGGN